MKKIYFALIILAITMLPGCTQNNGHIGPIFGSWSVVGIKQDGRPLDLNGETVFSFQNEIVQVAKLVAPPYSITTRYGNFQIDDETLTMKFQLTPTESYVYQYVLPDWLYFPQDSGLLHFDIKKLKGSEMVLTLDTGDKILEYSFKKTW